MITEPMEKGKLITASLKNMSRRDKLLIAVDIAETFCYILGNSLGHYELKSVNLLVISLALTLSCSLALSPLPFFLLSFSHLSSRTSLFPSFSF